MPSRLFRRIPWATLRVRLTLWNTAVVLLASLASLYAVRIGTRTALYREADVVLRGEVNEIAIALGDLHPDTDAVIAELRRKATGHQERGWFTQLLNGKGTTLWKSESCPRQVIEWPVAHEKVENLVQVEAYRFARRRITDPDDEPFHIRIGMSTDYLEEDINDLTRLLIPVGLMLLLLTPLAGYWLALRATRPVGEILSRAEGLKPTRLGDRLEVHGTRDELDRLSLTINRLLDQVAGHVERQQQFVADAAHELRGPLSAMQSSLEVALAQDRNPADYRESLVDVLEETRQLSKLANDLLLLAETVSETRTVARDSICIAAIARQSVAMFAGVAEDRGITLTLTLADGLWIDPRAPGHNTLISGDAAQIRQVLSNLLDNSLRFTVEGGRITVLIMSPKNGEVVLSVTDTGCGIEEQHLARVFDRFYQTDAARNRADTRRGGGLGLAICQSIVERHGGRIGLVSRLGWGTIITIHLPII